MKTIGLIGGISWQSTAEYYRIINQLVNKKLGGNNSAQVLLYSVNFHEIETGQIAGDWDLLGKKMADAAKRLEKGGADCLLICANTMHKVAHYIEQAAKIPLIHIIDVTAYEIIKQKLDCVGLLGTRFTMGETFYIDRLKRHGIRGIIPDEESRAFIHRTIHEELIPGKIVENSKKGFLEIIEDLFSRGAQGIILGCTEIPLLITAKDTKRTLFDTTFIHANSVVEYAVENRT